MAAALPAPQFLLLLLPVAGSIMLAYGVAQMAFDLRRGQRRHLLARLKGGAHKTADDSLDYRRKTIEVTGLLAPFFQKLKFTQRFQVVLEQADVQWSAPHVLVNLTAIALASTAALLALRCGPTVAFAVGAGVFVLPILYLFKRRRSRLNKFVAQLPDVFELLSQALRAGHSLASAMQLVSRQAPKPAAAEFGRVFHEQNLGLKVEDALRNLAERTDLLDVRFFVTAVLIQRQTGGDLAEVLDKLGTVIRDRIKLFGTVQALTAEGRLSGYVLLALPPIVLAAMMFLNRDYAMTLFNHPTGRMLITGAGVSQFMGWMMIKKIVNIKV
jgi:tight adherence protein B